MITTLLFDFSNVLLFAKQETASLNNLYKQLQRSNGFDFFGNYKLNAELLNFLTGIKDKYSLYIFTSGQIQKDFQLKQHLTIFKHIFSAEDLGLDKQDSYAYSFITKQKIGVKPENTLFIDDQQRNLSAAVKSGLATFLYKNNEELIAKLSALD